MATLEQQLIDLTTKVDALATAVAVIPGGVNDTAALTQIQADITLIKDKLPA